MKPSVTLISGEVVSTWSEAWRHETECRYILSLSSFDERRRWLDVIEAKRGKGAADWIRHTMAEIEASGSSDHAAPAPSNTVRFKDGA